MDISRKNKWPIFTCQLTFASSVRLIFIWIQTKSLVVQLSCGADIIPIGEFFKVDYLSLGGFCIVNKIFFSQNSTQLF